MLSKLKEMNALQSSSCENDLKLALKSYEFEPTHFRNNSQSFRILEELQSPRKNKVLCDFRFKNDDGKIEFGFKNVLMASSPYLYTMLSKIDETNKDLVNIRVLDSTVLHKLVDYICTDQMLIMVAKENVQVLLPAAKLLHLDFVNGECVEFLHKEPDQSNCLSIKAFADLHKFTELLSSSDSLKKKQFLEVVKSIEILFLSSEDVVKIISYNNVVQFEKKVFKSVISGLKYDLDQRKEFLSELTIYVRFPLLGTNYTFETLHFNLHNSVLHFTIPQTIRCKLRQFDDSQKVILLFKRSKTLPKCNTEWYDPVTKLRKNAPGMNDCRQAAGLDVIRDKFVFAVGGMTKSSCQSVTMLDVSLRSPCWVPMANMLISRKLPGVGVLNDCIYAIGGYDGASSLNSVEVFDFSVKKWQMVSSMSVTRKGLGVGVLNNILYAVGGANGGYGLGSGILKSVECYDPSLDKWTPVSEMSEYRVGVGVGVLDGVMYAIGGFNGSEMLKSVEIYRPNDGVWSLISEMHLCRCRPGVVALNGLLYVIGGETEISIADTIEIYNPKTNIWSMETLSRSGGKIYGGVVVDRSPNFIIN